MTPAPHLLSISAICKMTGYGRTTVYRHRLDPAFPKPIGTSDRDLRWRLDEIEAFYMRRRQH